MIKEAIEKILGLAEPMMIKVDDRDYSSKALFPVKEPTPADIQISTLTGLVDYIEKEIDDLEPTSLMVQVKNHTSVHLISNLSGKFLQRHGYISAGIDPGGNIFGTFMDVERFIIVLQSQFVSTPSQAQILALIGNLTDENVTNVADDGVTQNVTARVGIAKVANIEVPNPVTLQPYRTFLEIEQPESQFIFRMKSGQGQQLPQCALFEADGGRWKLNAIYSIRDWLRERLPDIAIIA